MADNKVDIMIFGTGGAARKALELIEPGKVNIIAYIDNDVSKQGGIFNNVHIISPIEVELYEYDYIVIGSSYYTEIEQQLIQLRVNRNRIVRLFKSKEKSFREKAKDIYFDNIKYLSIVKEEHLSFYFQDYAVCNMFSSNNDRNKQLYKYPDYILQGIDYVRISTLDLMAREIKEKDIQGAVAELGVYRGDFSKLIYDKFQGRKLYLFDTFEGFAQEDVDYDIAANFSNSKVGHLGDSNEEIVLNKIGASENCIIMKGYFPESSVGVKEEEKFVFVSIDTDLYKPTFEGLKFFYSRLVTGGFILIHDYNHPTYTGVKKAVNDFCREVGISFVPISDHFGSAVITK